MYFKLVTTLFRVLIALLLTTHEPSSASTATTTEAATSIPSYIYIYMNVENS